MSKNNNRGGYNKKPASNNCSYKERQPRKAEIFLYVTLLSMKSNAWFTLYDLTSKYNHSHATVIRWLSRLSEANYAKKKLEFDGRKRILYQLTPEGKIFIQERIDNYNFEEFDKKNR